MQQQQQPSSLSLCARQPKHYVTQQQQQQQPPETSQKTFANLYMGRAPEIGWGECIDIFPFGFVFLDISFFLSFFLLLYFFSPSTYCRMGFEVYKYK
jgi:hypothetical protein